MKKYFEFDKLGTNYRKEILGGLTTFLAMAYILVVNPNMLTLSDIPDLPDALRMDYGAVFVATAVSAAIGCFIMGILAKYPLALAPGLGLNAFFAYTVILTNGSPWEHALAAVFVSGVFFLILTLTGLREKLINAIPMELKIAVGAGIGLFVSFIGLKKCRNYRSKSSNGSWFREPTRCTSITCHFRYYPNDYFLSSWLESGRIYWDGTNSDRRYDLRFS